MFSFVLNEELPENPAGVTEISLPAYERLGDKPFVRTDKTTGRAAPDFILAGNGLSHFIPNPLWLTRGK